MRLPYYRMRLFHLTTAEHAISNIASSRIKVARFNDLNDPFELLAAELKDKEFRKAVKSWKNDFHNTIGLLCFSESWQNPVLWSHYADKHRGICLGLDIPDKYAIPVDYSRNRIPVAFKDNDPEQGLSPDFVKEMLHTKYEHWAYEKERRMFFTLDEVTKEGELYFCHFDDDLILRDVIVGAHCDIPVDHIENLVAKTNGAIEITKARLGFTHFEVVPDQRYERKK